MQLSKVQTELDDVLSKSHTSMSEVQQAREDRDRQAQLAKEVCIHA